jgi:hypothetical protein
MQPSSSHPSQHANPLHEEHCLWPCTTFISSAKTAANFCRWFAANPSTTFRISNGINARILRPSLIRRRLMDSVTGCEVFLFEDMLLNNDECFTKGRKNSNRQKYVYNFFYQFGGKNTFTYNFSDYGKK